jgi:hypothetical protein
MVISAITPEIDRLIRNIPRIFKGDEDEIPTIVKVVYNTSDDELTSFTPYVEITSGDGVDPREANGLMDDLGMEFISSKCDKCINANVSNWTLPSVAAVTAEAAERKAIRATG